LILIRPGSICASTVVTLSISIGKYRAICTGDEVNGDIKRTSVPLTLATKLASISSSTPLTWNCPGSAGSIPRESKFEADQGLVSVG
jgi:hypothetical protein